MDALLEWFGSRSFMPHGHCYLWRPSILWLHVGSDAVIAAAYFSIPLALLTFVRRRTDVAFGWIFVLFGAFILLCGLTHAMGIWTTWNPDYAAEGLIKAATAAVSAVTALLLWPLLPRALRLPSPHQLELANERYRALNAELDERVRERTRELEHAIEERDREMGRQRRLSAALARSNDDLGRVASFLSHELRQPLHGARLATELLRGALAASLSSEQRATVQRLDRALARMHDLVESELALALVTGAAETWGVVALDAVAAAAIEQVEEELRATGARVERGPLPRVAGNPTQLRQLFVNLLSNAIRYRRSDAPLEIRIRAEAPTADVARIVLEDNGAGFPAQAAAQLFEPFERAGRDDGSGLGLGLAICRRIARRHGGEIEAAAREGAGARFTIVLPLPGETDLELPADPTASARA